MNSVKGSVTMACEVSKIYIPTTKTRFCGNECNIWHLVIINLMVKMFTDYILVNLKKMTKNFNFDNMY
jgi:hypothetical protein